MEGKTKLREYLESLESINNICIREMVLLYCKQYRWMIKHLPNNSLKEELYIAEQVRNVLNQISESAIELQNKIDKNIIHFDDDHDAYVTFKIGTNSYKMIAYNTYRKTTMDDFVVFMCNDLESVVCDELDKLAPLIINQEKALRIAIQVEKDRERLKEYQEKLEKAKNDKIKFDQSEEGKRKKEYEKRFNEAVCKCRKEIDNEMFAYNYVPMKWRDLEENYDLIPSVSDLVNSVRENEYIEMWG